MLLDAAKRHLHSTSGNDSDLTSHLSPVQRKAHTHMSWGEASRCEVEAYNSWPW